MNSPNNFALRLETTLRALPIESPEIRVYPADPAKYKYFGSVTSRSFEGLDDGRRQAMVWDQILNTIDDEDQRRIEFVYTHAPSERITSDAAGRRGQDAPVARS